MKKTIIALCLVLALFITGCTAKEKNITGSLEDIMTKVYAGIPEDKLPMMLKNMPVNKENLESYLGTADLDIKEAIASESMTGSIAHSVVLVRMNEKANIEEAKKLIKEHVNPRKWICVEAENVIIESKGDLIILIMSNEEAKSIQTNFKKLK
ncbi:MAG: hypothetical protein RR047_02940 [Bacilli bacterium]